MGPRRAAAAVAMAMAIVIGASGSSSDAQPSPRAPADQARVPPERRLFDGDGNKILDNFDHRLAHAPRDQAFDVVVLTDRPVEEAAPALEEAVGPFRITRRYPSVNGFATRWTKEQVTDAARREEVLQIEHDERFIPSLDSATHWFGVRRLRLELPQVTGAGQTIAVIDSGIHASHQDFAGKLVGWFNTFTGSTNPADAFDEGGACNWHGTHVTSIAAGSGAASGGLLAGVAPAANLVGVKALRVQQGLCTGSASGINAGLQWVIDNRAALGITVANLSLSIVGCSDGQSSTERLVNQLVASGVVVAVAAGNEGPNTCTIGAPGAAAHAVTVGAMADVEQPEGTATHPAHGFYLAQFSSRGPTADARTKPDVSAPGVRINAALGGTTSGYQVLSGTSMASPFVAGVAALLRHAGAAAPSGSCTVVGGTQTCTINDPVRSRLLTTARTWGGTAPNINYGVGRVDAYAAVRAQAGGTGDQVRLPDHLRDQASLSGTGDKRVYTLNVATTYYPIAVTMIMDTDPVCGPPGPLGCDVDFDLHLLNPSGVQVTSAQTTSRQETLGVPAATTGDYTLEVRSFSGAGGYSLDVSYGGSVIPPPRLARTTDGNLAFGFLPLGGTAASTSDPQTFRVDLGPADLRARSTAFAAPGSTWALGAAAGTDTVVWEFSTNAGIAWTTFGAPDLLHNAVTGLKDGEQATLLFRITMPTTTTSGAEHGATVTVSAAAPE